MASIAVLTPADVREQRLKRFTPHEQQPRPSIPSSSSTIDSEALFHLGFYPEAVGRALVSTRGDAAAALKVLQRQADGVSKEKAAPAEEAIDDEARQLELALKMSLEPAKKAPRPSTSSSGANPLWQPPRYLPAGHSVERGSKTLSLVESVRVRDGGYAWQAASAFLDTGNQAITLIDPVFAARHAIYKPDAAAALLGTATGFGQAERWQTIRGVVPGASTRAPVVTVALKVRDQEMTIQAAVSEMHGHDLLLGADVIARLFEAGFRLGAGSM